MEPAFGAANTKASRSWDWAMGMNGVEAGTPGPRWQRPDSRSLERLLLKASPQFLEGAEHYDKKNKVRRLEAQLCDLE